MNKKQTIGVLELPVAAEAEVVVIGGGPAGVGAALAAARNGADVLLIEQRGYMGGMATVSLVPAYCPFTDRVKPVIRGIGLEVLRTMMERMGLLEQAEWRNRLDWVPIDAELLKLILDEKAMQAGVRPLFHSFMSHALHEDGYVHSILISNKNGLQLVKGRYFIDASSDADLVVHAGGKTVKGSEDGELQPGTMCFVLSNLNRRDFMPHAQSLGYDLKYAIAKAKAEGTLRVAREWAGISWHNDHTAGFNFGHVFGIDGSDAADLTRGAIEGRALVHHIVGWLREHIPGFAHATLTSTGEQVGIRETRRIVGDYVVTADDFIAARSFEDDIARNSYFIDIHMAKPTSGMTIVHLEPGQSHGIPYRALLPIGLENVLVAGRAISTDRVTQGSTRVMPNCFAMGEAAGTAAAQLVRKGLTRTREIDMNALQLQLVRQGAWLGEELQARYGQTEIQRIEA